MKLYIANCTRQNMNLQYRMDYNTAGERESLSQFRPARQQDIPPGRQVQIGSDMHMNQIEDIVQQLVKYGLQGEVDVPNLKTSFKKLDPRSNKPTPMVFNIDRAVRAETIRHVMDLNAGILRAQGQVRRQQAAIATNELVQHKVANELAQNGIDQQPTDRIDITFEQLEQSEAGEPMIAEGYKIGADGQAPGANVERPGARGGKGKKKGK